MSTKPARVFKFNLKHVGRVTGWCSG